jgi:glycosyltransferase involved in cell wall biosynthesis
MALPAHPRVAIVHDWLYGGGAERVVYELHKLYPDAPIYTAYCSDEWRARLDHKVVTGYLQRWPCNKLRKPLAALRMHRWFSNLDFTGYDLVISSSGNGQAMDIRVPRGTMHVSYCHTPTHYYWRHYNQYLERPGFGVFDPLARLGLKLLVRPLRKGDYEAAQRPDYLIANSQGIQADIRQYYGRESTVIYPPVEVSRFSSVSQPPARQGLVTAGRQVPMKRFDLAIQAANELQLPLKVIGRGPDHNRLVRLAGPTVTFLTDVKDDEMAAHLASAQAFLFCSHEDFGITPVEALAAGTPLVAYKAGGALDFVEPGITGLFFDEQTVESLVNALRQLPSQSFDTRAVQAGAARFSPQAFQTAITTFITTHS